MGNCVSKRAQQEQAEKLDGVESRYAAAATSLVAREQDLAHAKTELEASKARETNASRDASALQKRVELLDSQCTALKQARQRDVAKLQAELKQKDDEALEERWAAESRTQERNALNEKLKKLGERLRMADEEHQLRERDMEAAAVSKDKVLESGRSERDQLQARVKMLEQSERTLTNWLSTTRTIAAEDTRKAKANATSQLDEAKASAAQELSKSQASATCSAQKVAALSSELGSTRAALDASSVKLEALQRTKEAFFTEAGTPGKNAQTYYYQPVQFSVTPFKDLRVEISEWKGEEGLDIREWRSGARTRQVSCTRPLNCTGRMLTL